MTKEIAERIARGITDKIKCNTVDIDDWAEFWGFTREEYEEFLEMLIKALEQQPCEDAVGRQALIDKATSWDAHFTDSEKAVSLADIMSLPSVTPQPKVGKWIPIHPLQADDDGAYLCSCCKVGNWGADPTIDKYCFNCGAKMEVEK